MAALVDIEDAKTNPIIKEVLKGGLDTKTKSVALKYKDIVGMKRAERQSLVKGVDVLFYVSVWGGVLF